MSLRDDIATDRARADSELVKAKDAIESLLKDLRENKPASELFNQAYHLRNELMMDAVMTLSRVRTNEAAVRVLEDSERAETARNEMWADSKERLANTYESAPWLRVENDRPKGKSAACADP